MLKRDVGSGIRKARLIQILFLQGILAAGIVYFIVLSEGLSRLLSIWTLVFPIGFSLAYWQTFQRGEAARREKRWTPQFEVAESRRVGRWLGVTAGAWVVGAFLIWYFGGGRT